MKTLFWGALAALAWTHVAYPAAAVAAARLRPRPVRKGDDLPPCLLDRRGSRRGSGDRAAAREPARARLPGRQARARRRVRRVDRRDRRARRAGAARAADPLPAGRQGRGAEPGRARDERRDRRVLRRERDLGAECAAGARAQLRRPRRRVRLRAASPRRRGWHEPRGRVLAVRARRPRGRVAAALGHRRQRLDLRRAPLGLRRRRPPVRARPLVPVPDGAARPARGVRTSGNCV